MQWKSILRKHVTKPSKEAMYSVICTQRPGLPKDGNLHAPYAIQKTHPEWLPFVSSVNIAIGRMLSRSYVEKCHKCSRRCNNIVKHLFFFCPYNDPHNARIIVLIIQTCGIDFCLQLCRYPLYQQADVSECQTFNNASASSFALLKTLYLGVKGYLSHIIVLLGHYDPNY